jgi:pyrroloquinoline quinone biosynthesis protein B
VLHTPGMKVLAAVLALAAATRHAAPSASVEAVVLGIAQDGGVPHAGCHQKLCVDARRDPSKRRLVASLGLVDPTAGKRFLVDATPDFAVQMERLGGLPDAILLTHAHIGHYLGLAQLGREVLNTRGVPLLCTPSMAKFLRDNRPWSRLVEMGNVEVRELEPGTEVELTPSLHVTAIRVPHRDEDSDTIAFLVRGPSKKVLWLPDIDKWEKWDRRLPDFLADPDLTAFVDGTFHSADEIPGRSIADIPHPLVSETLALFGATPPRGRLFFVHLNHTNRLLWDPRAAKSLNAKGIGLAREGMRVRL